MLNASVLSYLQDSSQTIPDGYYFGMDSAISTAYQMGLTAGATNTNLDNVSIEYTVQHTHGAYCKATKSHVIDSNRQSDKEYRSTGHCTACGASFDSGWTTASDGFSKTQGYVYNIYIGHSCNPPLVCGQTEGTRTTTDTTTLVGGDKVVSATITY